MASSVTASVLFVFDFGDPLLLTATKEAVKQFANLFVLQARPLVTSLRVGLCGLSKQSHVQNVQLQVKLRPGELLLRDFHAALGRVQCGNSSDGVAGSQAALALHSLLQLVATDREALAAQHKTVVLLTDRQYDAEEFQWAMQPIQERGIGLDIYLACALGCMEAAAGAWPELEAQFPSLNVAVMESPGKEAYRGLTAAFLERYGQLEPTSVNLQFKVPLLGDVRSLQLWARPAAFRLHDGVDHAPICPCHKLPGLRGCIGASCTITGEPLASASSKDVRTIQIGSHPGGLLHFASPFNIAAGATGQAALTVVQRVKREHFNPACVVGMPLVLGAKACQLKIMHEGALLDVAHQQLLQSLGAGLREAGELLIASSMTNLETGQAGLLRQYYAISPSSAGQPLLHASRITTAEELPAPVAVSSAQAAAELPHALAETVWEQLSQVPLGNFDPLALSSRCHETIEMLVMESKPLPKPQAVPLPQQAARQPAEAGAAAAAARGASRPPAAAAAVPAVVGAKAAASMATPPHVQAPDKAAQPVVRSIAGASLQAAAGKTRKGGAPKQAASGKAAQQGGKAGLALQRVQR